MENAGIGGTIDIGLRATWPPVGLSVANLDAIWLHEKEIYHRPPLKVIVFYAF